MARARHRRCRRVVLAPAASARPGLPAFVRVAQHALLRVQSGPLRDGDRHPADSCDVDGRHPAGCERVAGGGRAGRARGGPALRRQYIRRHRRMPGGGVPADRAPRQHRNATGCRRRQCRRGRRGVDGWTPADRVCHRGVHSRLHGRQEGHTRRTSLGSAREIDGRAGRRRGQRPTAPLRDGAIGIHGAGVRGRLDPRPRISRGDDDPCLYEHACRLPPGARGWQLDQRAQDRAGAQRAADAHQPPAGHWCVWRRVAGAARSRCASPRRASAPGGVLAGPRDQQRVEVHRHDARAHAALRRDVSRGPPLEPVLAARGGARRAPLRGKHLGLAGGRRGGRFHPHSSAGDSKDAFSLRHDQRRPRAPHPPRAALGRNSACRAARRPGVPWYGQRLRRRP